VHAQAQIRKHVFDVIEEQDSGNKSAENDKVALIRHTPTDQLALQLVREFLDYYELDYTASVFHSEARVVRANNHAIRPVVSNPCV
jgi:FGFR1 oncogene partner